jgi:hypothetical protein
MKTTKRCQSPFLAVLAFLCLCACQIETEDEGGDLIKVNLPLDTDAVTLDLSEGRYYSLSTGEEVTGPAGDNWDIVLESHGGAFFILTNSGITADETAAWTETAQSGGGGVWFTNSKDFRAVTLAAQRIIPAGGDEYEPYTVDAGRWTMSMAAAPVRQFLNVMTYVGYPTGNDTYPLSGDGSGLSAENCFRRYDVSQMSASYSPYLFNRMESYSMGGGMPPVYGPTKRVYIVRHGDGTSYSKVQLSEVYREPGSPSHFVMQVRYAPVE